MKWNRLGLCAALAMCLAAADAPKTKKPAQSKPKQAAPATAAGMVIVKDPDGALRAPTAAESQALAPRSLDAFRLGANTAVDLGPGKGQMVVLNPAETNVYSVVTKGPDGKLRMHEVTGQQAADKAVAAGAGVQSKKGEWSEK